MDINSHSFDNVLDGMQPRLSFEVPDRIRADGKTLKVDLEFHGITDFSPQRIASRVKPVSDLLSARDQLAMRLTRIHLAESPDRAPGAGIGSVDLDSETLRAEAPNAPAPGTSTLPLNGPEATDGNGSTQWASVLRGVLIDRLQVAPEVEGSQQAAALPDEFVDRFLSPAAASASQVHAMISDWVGRIDVLVSAQLNEILHAAPFLELEASWRGIHYLVQSCEPAPLLQIRVLNCTKAELVKDFEKSPYYDQSLLFRKVYEDEFATLGGSPFGLLVGDYEFTRQPQDIDLLTEISKIAAVAHAPFISAASPKLLGLDAFSELSSVRNLGRIFEAVEFVSWRTFCSLETSRYVGLCLPRVLLRPPHSHIAADGFTFQEDTQGNKPEKYLWGNPAYAFATRVVDAFTRYHWCAAIRGILTGGLVSGLSAHSYATPEDELARNEVARIGPTDATISEELESSLAAAGFIPLISCRNTDYAVVFSTPSCHSPPRGSDPQAHLIAQLPYVFAGARIAQYINVMIRDKIGSILSRTDCEAYLNSWMSRYVTPDESASDDVKVQLPLRHAEVKVFDVPGRPGHYTAVLYIIPHFQLKDLAVPLRVFAELPTPVRTDRTYR